MFSPDSHTLITAGDDGIVRSWDIGFVTIPSGTSAAEQATPSRLSSGPAMSPQICHPGRCAHWRVDSDRAITGSRAEVGRCATRRSADIPTPENPAYGWLSRDSHMNRSYR